MNHVGPRTKLWLRTLRRWKQLNRPNFEGFYVCHYCQKWIPASEITLDHIIPRSRAPELLTDHKNLVPACSACNGKKGSRVAA